eukprot:g4424.t1
MKLQLQILGTDRGDSCPSLLVTLDDKKYVFSVGECFQRFCFEHGVRLKNKLQGIFLPYIDWKTVGGLPGLLLTLADAGSSVVSLNGPNGLGSFLYSTRQFFRREALRINLTEFNEKRVVDDEFAFNDGILKIFPISVSLPLQNEKEDPFHHLPEITEQHLRYLADIRILSSTKTCNSGKEGNNRKGRRKNVLCYFCHPPTAPGKFFPNKAKELGVPRGPMFAQLVKGNSVTLQDGTIVRPEQCVASRDPTSIFGVIFCPTIEWISALTQHEDFKGYYSNGEAVEPNANGRLECLVHMASKIVVEDVRYQKWIKKFGENVQNIFLSRDNSPLAFTFDAAAVAQSSLHSLHPSIFPKLHGNFFSKGKNGENDEEVKIGAQQLLSYTLIPKKSKGFDQTSLQLRKKRLLERQQVSGKTVFETKSTFKNLILNFQQNLASVVDLASKQDNFNRGEQQALATRGVTVSFLGTGSALPTRLRNVSSIYLNFDGNFISKSNLDSGNSSSTISSPLSRGILLDCGEGTYGQLLRMYGHDEVNSILSQLKCIYISHMHADHNLGVVRILMERNAKEKRSPVLIIGPPRLQMFLNEYSSIDSSINGAWKFLSCREVMSRNHPFAFELAKDCGITLFNVRVFHPADAYGVIIEASGGDAKQLGWKIVYSGDTRPCDALVRAGKNATLLIHEATFEDGMQVEALKKKHSTVTEAIDVSRKMGAFRTILTHFSARYPNIPPPIPDLTHTSLSTNEKKKEEKIFGTPKLSVSLRGFDSTCGTKDIASTYTDTTTTATSNETDVCCITNSNSNRNVHSVKFNQMPTANLKGQSMWCPNSYAMSTDFMTVTFEDLLWLPSLLPVMRELYKYLDCVDEDCIDEDNLVLAVVKNTKRKRKSNSKVNEPQKMKKRKK